MNLVGLTLLALPLGQAHRPLLPSSPFSAGFLLTARDSGGAHVPVGGPSSLRSQKPAAQSLGSLPVIS